MSCKKNNVDYNVNMNETAKLLAYCVIILMITIGVFSLSYFDDETYNEEWYKKNSMIITAAVIITCFISLGGYFIRLAFGKKGGFLNPKMILFVAFLGYLFDWISLTNDITRFTEEDEYTWYGDKRAFITSFKPIFLKIIKDFSDRNDAWIFFTWVRISPRFRLVPIKYPSHKWRD